MPHRRSCSRLPAAFALSFFCSISAASAWNFEEGEEDWGPICIVHQNHSGGKLTLMSSKGSFNPSLMISLPKYPKNNQNIPVRITIDPIGDYRLKGAMNDYFGEIDLKLSRVHINSLKNGKSLNITFEDISPVRVSLQGMTPALNAFLACTRKTAKPAAMPTKPPPPRPAIAAPPGPAPARPAPIAQPRPPVAAPVRVPLASSPPPRPPRPLPSNLMQQLVGDYVRKPTVSDWHRGRISHRGGQLVWTNKARVSWKLYPDPANPNMINTGTDNPYYAKYPNARRFQLTGSNGRITGFIFGGSTYHRQRSGAVAGVCAGQPLGSLRLPPDFRHQRQQGIDSIIGAVEKPGGLRIAYEIGRITPPGGARTGGSFTNRAAQAPPAQLRWSGVQTVNGGAVHIAYRRDNWLLASFPGKGMNMSTRAATPEQMASALMIMLSYGGPDCVN